MLEVVIIKRSQITWEWQVCDRSGEIVMHGREKTRRAAKYRGYRSLFLLLGTGWHTVGARLASPWLFIWGVPAHAGWFSREMVR
jgi:hypothetical protein